MAVTAEQVKELRDLTGAGIMDCKKVLVETDGDIKRAIELLKERGIAKAAKKAGRVASEGLVEAYIHNGKYGSLVEVNSETDFVANNEDFKNFDKKVRMSKRIIFYLFLSTNLPLLFTKLLLFREQYVIIIRVIIYKYNVSLFLFLNFVHHCQIQNTFHTNYMHYIIYNIFQLFGRQK